ncbi:MAG TPA: leucine-rich repeat protein [Tissierellaceae bacterium]|nr:leucine-rich repeat protein [Tissierellaceae bacterium]
MQNKRLTLILSLTMILSMFSTTAFGVGFTDMPSNWSTGALEKAVANGLLKGDNDKIRSEDSLTRAEMATIVNRSFNADRKTSLTKFNDVPQEKWYYEEMAKAVQMKTFVGSGDSLNPEQNITREEAFVVLARAFKISGLGSSVLDSFNDKEMVSGWAKEEMAALVSSGYIAGSNGQLNPKDNITRAEFAQIMDNLIKTYITKAGDYTTDFNGNVMVNVPGVTLKGLTITGDLIIGDGVAEGEVIIDDTTVTGRVLVRGGGVDSIKIIGNSSIKSILIAKVDGKVRVYTEDGVEIGEVIIDGYDDVILEGNFALVVLRAENVTVFANNTNIKSVVVTGAKSKILVDKGSSIDKIVINNNGVMIEGKGKVKEVLANANDIVVTVLGTRVIAGDNTKGVMAGEQEVIPGKTETVQAEEVVTPPSSGGAGGGGGGSTDGGSTEETTIALTNINITGEYTVGYLLTAELKPLGATASYQWMRSDAIDGTYEDIVGATSNTYSLIAEDIGKYIKVSATGKGTYSGNVTSNATNKSVTYLGMTEEEAQSAGFEWESEQFNGTITGYKDEAPKDVIIPSKINGVPVTTISDYSFMDKGLTSLRLPSSLLEIGIYAFSGNKLTSLILPESVIKIGLRAFESNELISLKIPTSVIKIEGSAFNNNQLSQEEAFIYERNEKGIEDKTKIVSYGGSNRENVVIPYGTEILGDFSFAFNSITGVTIPNSVTIIQEAAFYANSLTAITIPDSITIIGVQSFAENELKSLILPESVIEIGGVAFTNNKLTSLLLPNSLERIGGSAFEGNKLTSLIIPNSVIKIGSRAFNDNQLTEEQAFIYERNLDGTEDKTKIISYGGKNRDNVIIPDGVETLGTFSFSFNNMTKVTISDSVINIEEGAFHHNSLTEVNIPDSVTTIGFRCFYNNKLTYVILGDSVTSIGAEAFNRNGPYHSSGNIDGDSYPGTWSLNDEYLQQWIKDDTAIRHILTGKVSLPNNEVAPVGGVYIFLNVQVEGVHNGGVSNIPVLIPEGSNSKDYSVMVPDGRLIINYRLRNNYDYINKGYYNELGTTIDFNESTRIELVNSNIEDIDIELLKGHELSGIISLPNGEIASDGGISIFISVEGEYNFYSDTKIPKGENSVEYSARVIDGEYKIEYSISQHEQGNYVQKGYYGDKGSTPYLNLASEVNVAGNDISNLDIEVLKGKSIKGVINLPTGEIAPVGGIEIDITIEGEETYDGMITIPENMNSMDYSMRIPDGDYKIWYSNRSNDEYVRWGYYSVSGMVSNHKQASIIEVLDEDVTNIDMELEKGHVVTGTVFLPDDINSFTGEQVSVEVEGIGNNWLTPFKSVNIENNNPLPFKIRLLEGMYRFSTVGYHDEMYNGRLYYNSEKTTPSYSEMEIVNVPLAGSVSIDMNLYKKIILESTYPYEGQQDYYPMYSYLTLKFSEDMESIRERFLDLVSITTEDGEEIIISGMEAGVEDKTNMLIVLEIDLDLDTNHTLIIPKNIIKSTNDIPYEDDLEINFRTAHTVLKGEVISDFDISGLKLQLIDDSGAVINERTLTDGSYRFVNMQAGDYLIKVIDDDVEYIKEINIEGNKLNIKDIPIGVKPSDSQYIVTLDGTTSIAEPDRSLYEANNKLWVPIRFVGEILSAEVNWNNTEKTATITKGETIVELIVDSDYLIIEDSTSFVDLGHVSEGLGYDLSWDLELKTINFTTIEGEPQIPPEDEETEVSSISVSPTEMTLELYNSARITATVELIKGKNRKVNWTTSDESVAQVNLNGLVTAVSTGTAIIIATSDADNTKSSICEVITILSDSQYIVRVDGTSSVIDTDRSLYEANNKLWVPLRFVAENLPVDISWNNIEETVTITKGETVVELNFNSEYLVIEGGISFIDLDYVSNGLGYDLSWDLELRTITFTTI